MSRAHIRRESLAVVLAGGYGSRLGALTRFRCKPALSFGGRYRSVDFTLSNCINSGVTRIGVATQYRARSLIRHIQHSFAQVLNRDRGEFIEPWAAEQHDDASWYAGTADAVFQNLASIDGYRPRYVVVLAADHVYRMDYGALIECHHDAGADVTVACQPVPAELARHFGVMSVDGDEIVEFREKPLGVANDGDVLASMGIYVFDTELLRSLLHRDALREDSSHDFGRDVIPACVTEPTIRVVAHPFRDPCTGGPGYWRDIGTVDAYWAASMELLAREPRLRLDDPDWPIWAPPDRSSPTLVVEPPRGRTTRVSRALIAAGCRFDGATVRRSIVSTGVCLGPGSVVEDSILLPGARIGADCHLRRAIVDEGMELPDGTGVSEHGMAVAANAERSPGGVTVFGRGAGERRKRAAPPPREDAAPPRARLVSRSDGEPLSSRAGRGA